MQTWRGGAPTITTKSDKVVRTQNDEWMEGQRAKVESVFFNSEKSIQKHNGTERLVASIVRREREGGRGETSTEY